MNRINALFQKKNKNILSVYFTAGYPELNDTVTIVQKLEKNGADLVEIGMPFSDPVADGPIIQHSSLIALKNGMSVKKLFEQLKDIRKTVKIPLILMGYLNPVLQFGLENFCKKCSETGIDGLIIPDLPLDEYLSAYKPHFEAAGLRHILLITPQTSDERMRQIDAESSGFIYMVSSSSTTGIKQNVADYQTAYFERVNRLGLKKPRIIGFGISNRETFRNACQYANGAIIGSAFVKALEGEAALEQKITGFIKTIVGKE
ncbi:MAG: tryptophan synthase subunit alpha [Prolixibacteraceae bacterium]|jgi:tryptophan synthase alpha chain|nr:tryptophan synthase subunit alpha [Prolixibacteraceae bacterium]